VVYRCSYDEVALDAPPVGRTPTPATISHVVDALRATFTTDADRLARQTGFLQRRRKITGSAFAQALVFGWLDDPTASIEVLAERLPTPDGPISP
jgi:hypothetical protein